MITIILHEEGNRIEVMSDEVGIDSNLDSPHIVIVNEKEKWTDSVSIFTDASESEQAEQIATYRNEGYEDRNP